jgi:hypothetical protein
VTWPAGSLEAKIRPIVDQLDPGDNNEVQHVVAALVPRSDQAWAAIAGLVADGLESRGLLERVPLVEPDLFPESHWVLPDRTRKVAADQKLAPVEELLAGCERDQPVIWERLTDQIKQGVEQQTDRRGG